MKNLQTLSILALAVSLSGCASIGLSFDTFKSRGVTYPDDMEQVVSFDKSVDTIDATISPAVYQPQSLSHQPIDIEIYDGPNMSGFQAVSYAQKEAIVQPKSQTI